ncbi:Sad1/UNC-like protein, partial [Lentinus brumalis]
GLRDYALKANGGRVARQLTSGNRGFLASRDDDPSVAIDDDVHAGRCWSFSLLPCQLGIRLPHMLYPSHVTVEHIPKSLVADIGQAPRNMTLWGVVDGRGNTEIFERLMVSGLPGSGQQTPPIARDLLWAPLASFSYDIDDNNPVQTFPVSSPMVGSGMMFGVVAIEVLDNWGSDTTCLYRVRIHGRP